MITSDDTIKLQMEMGRGRSLPEGFPTRGGMFGRTKEYEALMEILAQPRTDEEIAHSLAEDALCAYLRSVGLKGVADAWEKAQSVQGWWYA